MVLPFCYSVHPSEDVHSQSIHIIEGLPLFKSSGVITPRKPEGTIETEVLDWDPQGARRLRTLKEDVERTIQKEILRIGKIWKEEVIGLSTWKDGNVL